MAEHNDTQPKRFNKDLEVAALRYEPDSDKAPVVVALGQGYMAQRILEEGMKHDIPVVPDAELAHMLNKMNLGDEVPPELYTIVAQILVFVSQVDEEYGKIHQYRQAGQRLK